MAGERKRAPNRNLVRLNMPLAAAWREQWSGDDEQLRVQLNSFFAAVAPEVEALTTSMPTICKIADRDNQTLHGLLFGVTAGEALAYGATRLVQLRQKADAIVRRHAEGKSWQPLSTRKVDFPKYNDKDVATLLYVLRIAALGDQSASLIFSDGRKGLEFAQPEIDLTALLDLYSREGQAPGTAVLKEARKQFDNLRLVRRAVASGRLLGGERLDISPEFWLQASLPVKGGPAPTMQANLLARIEQVHEQKRRHQPPNVWLASGRDRPRRERPKKR